MTGCRAAVHAVSLGAFLCCIAHEYWQAHAQVGTTTTLCARTVHKCFSQPVGVGLFPTGALINHSCTPNVMQSFQQQQVTFTALQPIAAGTEITISYIELAATRAERRHQLQDQYYFDIDQDLPVRRKDPMQLHMHVQCGSLPAVF